MQEFEVNERLEDEYLRKRCLFRRCKMYKQK